MEVGSDVLSLIGLAFTALSFGFAYLKYIRAQEKRIATLEARGTDLAALHTDVAALDVKLDKITASEEDKLERIKALEVKIELWWAALQDTTIKMMRHPNTPERDTLFDKFEDKSITMAEMERLKELLQCEVEAAVKVVKQKKTTPVVAANAKSDVLVDTMWIARIDTLLYDMRRAATKAQIPHVR